MTTKVTTSVSVYQYSLQRTGAHLLQHCGVSMPSEGVAVTCAIDAASIGRTWKDLYRNWKAIE